MPQLFIISNEWNKQPWFSTGGTRTKEYLQSPDGKFYYFKRSQFKPGKDYRYEFWNEIIAFQVGEMLGFNMLRYDIAVNGEIMGCISESMINSEMEELIEGVRYLQAFAPDYDPNLKEHKKRYTFDLIENSLKSANLKEYIHDIIEIIVFDAIIGNGDRHQENWAVINKLIPMHEAIDELEVNGKLNKVNRFLRWLLRWLKKNVENIYNQSNQNGRKMPRQLLIPKTDFAPIYDSGSSLGLELLDERIEQLLNSEAELAKYIDNGQSEIYWENKKLSHFELIRKLLDSGYRAKVKSIIRRVLEKWNSPAIKQLIEEIDISVPKSHEIYKIPDNRKRLIAKILTLRHQRLEAIIHEGV